MKKSLLCALPLVAALMLPSAAAAADWDQMLGIYVWVPNVSGSADYGRAESQVSVDPGDVLDAFELGASARYRAQTDKWAIVFDGMYASLGGTKDSAPKTTLDLNEYIFQLDAAYRFNERTEVLFGMRMVRFETTLDLFEGLPGGGIHKKGDASFWDPVVGVRTMQPLGKSGKWFVQAQGDIGGGANMDFTWLAMLNFGYRPSAKTSYWFGYRALAMKFDDAGSNNKFGMDITTYAPEVGMALHF